MCITSGLCCAGNLFIQVILLLSSPGETPLTLFRQQVHTYYRLRLNQLLLRPSVLNPNVFSFDDSPLFIFCHVDSKTPPSEVYYHNYNVCLLPITRFVNILLVEVVGIAPTSTTTFKQLLRITSIQKVLLIHTQQMHRHPCRKQNFLLYILLHNLC